MVQNVSVEFKMIDLWVICFGSAVCTKDQNMHFDECYRLKMSSLLIGDSQCWSTNASESVLRCKVLSWAEISYQSQGVIR